MFSYHTYTYNPQTVLETSIGSATMCIKNFYFVNSGLSVARLHVYVYRNVRFIYGLC